MLTPNTPNAPTESPTTGGTQACGNPHPVVDSATDPMPTEVVVAALYGNSVPDTPAHVVKPWLVSSVAEVARSRLVTVGVDTLLADVAALLASAQISLVLVCDDAGVAVGVITETILVRQLGFGHADVFATRAGEVMARDFAVCCPDDPLAEVLAQMHHRGLIHVAILDEAQYPLGILNARDGLRAMLAHGHFEESLLRNYVMGIGYQ